MADLTKIDESTQRDWGCTDREILDQIEQRRRYIDFARRSERGHHLTGFFDEGPPSRRRRVWIEEPLGRVRAEGWREDRSSQAERSLQAHAACPGLRNDTQFAFDRIGRRNQLAIGAVLIAQRGLPGRKPRRMADP